MSFKKVVLTISICVLAAAMADAAQLPIVVEHTEVVPSDPASGRPQQIAVRVHNTGEHTVNAWGVIAHVKFLDGVTRAARTATDGYEGAFREIPNSSVLRADSRYTIMLDAPGARGGSPIASVSAEVWFVIFDNDAAAGDQSEIAFIFQQRALHLRVWRVIEKIVLDASAKASEPANALRLIDAHLSAIVDDTILKSVLFDGVQRKVAAALGPRNSHNLSASLQRLIAEVQTRRRAAEAHSERR